VVSVGALCITVIHCYRDRASSDGNDTTAAGVSDQVLRSAGRPNGCGMLTTVLTQGTWMELLMEPEVELQTGQRNRLAQSSRLVRAFRPLPVQRQTALRTHLRIPATSTKPSGRNLVTPVIWPAWHGPLRLAPDTG
jgi:hypothetical protein